MSDRLFNKIDPGVYACYKSFGIRLKKNLRWIDFLHLTDLKTIDLFAGVGGIRMAFERAGFKTVFANDFNKYCKITYDLNFDPPNLYLTSIWDLEISEIPDFDVLTGGFPCQAFSVAGKKEGFVKDRNLFKVANILDEKKPQAFFLENVKFLRHHEQGKTIQIIKGLFKDIGYYVKAEVLSSSRHANVPQSRDRIFIVGFRDEEKCFRFEFPKPIELTRKVGDFLDDEVEDK